MSPRFISNLLLALAGALLVVASMSFSVATTEWIAFGIGLAVLAMVGIVQLDRGRGLPQRALDGLAGALGIWTVVASVIFTGVTLTWLSFGEGLGFAALALAGLVAHELSSERIVHSLAIEERSVVEVKPAPSPYSTHSAS